MNFGFRRTIPHITGIVFGVLTVLALVGVGLGQVLVANPTAYMALRVASVIYMIWLAWRVATSAPSAPAEATSQGQPISALEAALFQWVNPKAWAMVVTAATAFAVPDNYAYSLLAMGVVFAAVNLPSAAIWAAAGTVLRQLLENPATVRTFNVVMALLLVASSFSIIWDLVKSL